VLYSSNLKKEAIRFSETAVTYYHLIIGYLGVIYFAVYVTEIYCCIIPEQFTFYFHIKEQHLA
jgi:hypothetical protein